MKILLRVAIFAALFQISFVSWAGCPGSGTTTNFTNSSAITIADNTTASPYPSNITVSGVSGTIARVTLTLNNLSHPQNGDLDMLLVAPNGAQLVFLSDVGGVGTTSNQTITIDDCAANQLPTTTASLTSGSFRPTASGSTADPFSGLTVSFPADHAAPSGTASFSSKFDGLNPNGTWRLYIVDDNLTAGQAGSVAGGWTLSVTTNVAASPTTTSVSSSVNPSLVGASVTFTATVTSSGNPVTVGPVTFRDGATVLANAVALNGSGQASVNTSSLPERQHSISATYDGASGFATSSGTLTQTVNTATTVNGNTFCNPGNLTINDNGPALVYPSNLTVSGFSGTLGGLTVSLRGLTHPQIGDVDMLLVAPTGQAFELFSDVGGANAVGPFNIDLSDSASSQLPTLSSFAAGTYRPTAAGGIESFTSPAPASFTAAGPDGSGTLASVFNGLSPNGTWRLFVQDDNLTGGQTGALASGWCLNLVPVAAAPTTTSLTSSANPSLVGATVTFTATVLNGQTPVTTGTVTFQEGSTVLAGPTALSGTGTAAFSTTSLSEGVHSITAIYSGTVTLATSNGSLNQTVDTPTTVSGSTYCNPGSITLLDNGPASVYGSHITVSGQGTSLSTLSLQLRNLTLPQSGDLDMLLVAPSGEKFVFLSDAGGTAITANADVTLSDTATNLLPSGTPISTGTYRPGDYGSGADTFANPAPAGPYLSGAPNGSASFTSAFASVNPNGVWTLFAVDDNATSGQTGTLAGGWCLNLVTPADLTISKSHSGDFIQGQTGATYSILVSNLSPSPTSGTVSVSDALPAGLTATAISGAGWNCSLGSLSCSRADVLSGNSSYPAITVTVNVAADAAAQVTNSATLNYAFDGNPNNNTANDATNVTANAGSPNLYPFIIRSGPTNGRIWSVNLPNFGTGTALNAAVTGLSLTQVAGAACTPAITSTFPASAGNIAPNATGIGTVTIDFSACVALARFNVVVSYSADGGYSGSKLFNNLFR